MRFLGFSLSFFYFFCAYARRLVFCWVQLRQLIGLSDNYPYHYVYLILDGALSKP